VLHWAYFKSAEARARFAQELAKQGFVVINEFKPENPKPMFPFGLQFQRSDTVESRVINEVTLALEESVQEYDGEYDGWETEVAKR
jgi:hypothetical protein